MNTKVNPDEFDYSNKGFLNYQEYTAYCLFIKQIPLKKSQIGIKINFEDIKFYKINGNKELFDFLSDKTDLITKETLKKACEKLSLKFDHEIMTILDDEITYEKFIKM